MPGRRVLAALLLNRRRMTLIVGMLLGLVLIALMIPRGTKVGNLSVPAPMWHGIVPGRTTEWEVRAIMGKPKMIKICPYMPGWLNPYRSASLRDVLACFSIPWSYVYEEERVPGKSPANNEIRLRYATVSAIVESEWLSPNESSPELLKRLIQDYGPPERVTWATQFPYYRAFLFCEHGVIVLANDTLVGSIIYFQPLPVSDCLKQFEYDVSTKDPFAGMGWPSVEDPWPWLTNVK